MRSSVSSRSAASRFLEQRSALATHVPGTPRALVDGAALVSQLDALERDAKERLALARGKAQAKGGTP